MSHQMSLSDAEPPNPNRPRISPEQLPRSKPQNISPTPTGICQTSTADNLGTLPRYEDFWPGRRKLG